MELNLHQFEIIWYLWREIRSSQASEQFSFVGSLVLGSNHLLGLRHLIGLRLKRFGTAPQDFSAPSHAGLS